MGLFEKLNELSKSATAPEAASSPPKAAASVPPLLDRLKEIGGKQLVNPPEPASAAQAPEPAPAAPEASGSVPAASGSVPASSSAATGTPCPFCKKVFQHLSRHKCPQAPAPVPVADGVFKRSHTASAPAPAAEGGLILILDALFERGIVWPGWQAVALFTDIIAPLAAAVAKENSQEHWGAVEFARGGPLLAAKLEKWLVATNPVGVIVADSSTPELRAVKEILKKHAKVIIQGVR